MAYIFVLLMTMCYYFGKQEATSSIKENKINEIKDIYIYIFSDNLNLQPYLLHSQIGKYKLAAW